MIPIFNATVEHNRLKLENPSEFSLWLGQFVGKQVEVIVRKKKKKRTTGKHDEEGNQNGWYWACILPLSAKHCGYTVDEMHEVFTELYAPYTIKKLGDKQVKVKVRTSNMDTVQFTEYCDTIRMVMAQEGVNIPDPDKVI